MNVLSEGLGLDHVDIVFVHGLRGDAIQTWSVDGVCWPRDLLPKDIPGARVLSWSYDSSIANLKTFSSQNSIFAHAENLLGDLALCRDGESESCRPIIFVGHSLGGLVIKEALCRSQIYLSTGQNPELGSVYSYTGGVVFMGTPHRGSPEENFASVVSKAAWATGRSPNDQLLRTLAEDSHILERQRLHFASITEYMATVCLFEEQPTPVPATFGMVSRHIVPQSSACYDGYRVQNSSINADHRNICKFSSASDIGYIRTRGHIRGLIKKAHEKTAESEKNRAQLDRELERVILDALNFSALSYRHDDIDAAFHNTFGWVFAPETGLSQWLSGNDDHLYWVNGKPGSGKSTLMKHLRHNPFTQQCLKNWAQRTQLIVTQFFFNDRGAANQKSLFGLIRTLLHQVISAFPGFAPTAFPEHWKDLRELQIISQGTARLSREFSKAEVLAGFYNILEQEEHAISICCFIDALDEYQGADREILAILNEMYARSRRPDPQHQSVKRQQFKLCVSARPHTVFETESSRSPGLNIQKHVTQDIVTYVNGRLWTRASVEVQLLQNLTQAVVSRSAGVFLWVRLAVESLLDGLENFDMDDRLWERVRLLPSDLEDFYSQMLRKIASPYQKEARRLFKIALEAPTRFQGSQFACYANIDYANLEAHSERYFSERNWAQARSHFKRRLRNISGGLLEIVDESKGQIQFIHQTAKDFLRKHVEVFYSQAEPDSNFSIDEYIIRSQLCFLKTVGRNSSTIEADITALFYYITRAKGLPFRTQIDVLKSIEDEIGVSFFSTISKGLKIFHGFTPLAVNALCLSWIRYKVEHQGCRIDTKYVLGAPLLYYAIEEDAIIGEFWFEGIGEYTGWPVMETVPRPPNVQMVELLLRYGNIQGLDVNQPPQEVELLEHQLQMRLSASEVRWRTLSPWKAFLWTLISGKWNASTHYSYLNRKDAGKLPIIQVAREYLKILEKFIEYGGDLSQLTVVVAHPSQSGLECTLLDALLWSFRKVGRDEEAEMRRILTAHNCFRSGLKRSGYWISALPEEA